ncbi:AAA ATPase central domain protein [Spirochaeta thermophila DSM 6578]|uniref:Replication-associated recombination protein A n=1 Tax=Winmispira thermophila (strain ATCC 700085 / DSM 6578 / Z-1203) TaxID=869211 RepID=G0GA48_WINT7|nr:AAA family ATPase [Spirochaeta thermophila]AEJ60884.1 AAA ATPase central domain protein [Spirochaeta thermophila DSM 6578]
MNRADNLFEAAKSLHDEPLAARMRPRTLDEFVGQEHILGPGRLLRRAIQADRLSSVIFYGPPGCGKTTLARVIANHTKSAFLSLNAVLSGVQEVRAAIEKARQEMAYHGRRTILFVDEVHRWNKAQQDALLPWVENGTVILIGATTQNPYFEVNSALISRSRIFQLKPLTRQHLRTIAERALSDPERGYGKYRIILDEDALEHLITVADGDARTLLSAIELAVETTPDTFPPPEGEVIHITREVAEDSIQRKAVLYDKEGDFHYDIISAFIKSLRGSDPDAAFYWLARMVDAGEDPHYIFRRMLILACEDVGMADPHAITVVLSCAQAFDRVGLPEGQYHLAHAALYLATCPKSNSVLGYFDALKAVREEKTHEVPRHLKDASRDAKGFGHGDGYLYPHSYREHWVAQNYLPAELKGRVFYQPSRQGYEARIREEVLRRRELQLTAAAQVEEEVLTFTPEKGMGEWWRRTETDLQPHLEELRDRIFQRAQIVRHHRVLVTERPAGFLVWEALRQAPEGQVVCAVASEEEAQRIRHQAAGIDDLLAPILITGTAPLVSLVDEARLGYRTFERILARNILGPSPDKERILADLASLLEPGGIAVCAEAFFRASQRLSSLVPWRRDETPLREALTSVEERLFADPEDPRVNWDEATLAELARRAGLALTQVERYEYATRRTLTREDVLRWVGDPHKGYGLHLSSLEPALAATIRQKLLETLPGREVPWRRTILIFRLSLAGLSG